MLVIPEEGTDFCNHINQEEGENRRKVDGEAVYTASGEATQTTFFFLVFLFPFPIPLMWKDSLTFLGHVVHAVGHRRALLLGVQGGEASVVVHKVVVCKKKNNNNIAISHAGGAAMFLSMGINCMFILLTNKKRGERGTIRN